MIFSIFRFFCAPSESRFSIIVQTIHQWKDYLFRFQIMYKFQFRKKIIIIINISHLMPGLTGVDNHMKCRVIIIKYEHKQIAGGSKGVTKDKSVSLFSTTHWRFAAHLLAHVSSCTPAGLMLSVWPEDASFQHAK